MCIGVRMPSPEVKILTQNLQALELFDARTAAIMRHADNTVAAIVPAPDAPWTLPIFSREDTFVFLGVGQGDRLLTALKQTACAILIIEFNVPALRRFLQHYDLTPALFSGRLRCVLPSMATPPLAEIALQEITAEIAAYLQRAQGALHFVATSALPPQAELYQSVCASAGNMASFINAIKTAPTHPLAYDVTVISPCCAIFDDLAHCFHKLGLRTQLFRVPDVSRRWTGTQRQEAIHHLIQEPSRLIITRNRALFEREYPDEYPQPETFLAGEKVHWWWDVPNLATHIDLLYPQGETHNLCFARAMLPLQLQGAQWLPPGAQSRFVEAAAGDMPEQDIALSFVGQSRVENVHHHLANLCSGLTALCGNLGKVIKSACSITQGYEALYRRITQRQPEIIEALHKIQRRYPTPVYYLKYLLDMAVTGAFRIAAIERLQRTNIDIMVYGDEGWLKAGVVPPRLFRGVIAPQDLPSLYRRSRINLNLNFMQVSSTVNPKVLDISACGGVVLTDYRPELEQLYPNPAVRPFAFHTLDEMVGMIDNLRTADLTQYVAATARHTREHHTLQQRAAWIAKRFNLEKSTEIIKQG